MTEINEAAYNELKEIVYKDAEKTLCLPTGVFKDLERAANIANRAILTVVERVKKCVELLPDMVKSAKTVCESEFGVPFNSLREMASRGIDLNYLRYSLKYHLFADIPARLYHLATRHKNPRVRKKNQKRIRKILYGK